jgi:hypothetical protein
MRFLVGTIDLEDPLPPTRGTKESQGQTAQPFSPGLSPLRVPVIRQELVPEQLVEVPVDGACREGLSTRLFIAQNIDLELGSRPELQQLWARVDGVGTAEGSPREMDRLPQVRARRLGLQLRPESRHDLFAVEPLRRREREQLHEVRTTTVTPGLGGHRSSIDFDREGTEEPDRANLPHSGK